MKTYTPNGDFGAQYIAFTDQDSSTVDTRAVLGWGDAGEGWPHLTPITSTPDGPQPLAFHPDRRYTYGHTADDAAWNLRQRAPYTKPAAPEGTTQPPPREPVRRGSCHTGNPVCGRPARLYPGGFRCDDHAPGIVRRAADRPTGEQVTA